MVVEHVMKPTNDLVFKALFGQDSSKEILKSLLEAVLKTTIADLSLLDPVIKIQEIEDKSPILDIRVETAENEIIDIEIQVAKQVYFHNRSLYYWARMYGGQLSEGEQYDKLKRAICINILSFEQFPDETEFHSVFVLQEQQRGFLLTDHLEIHFLELGKFHHDKRTVFVSKDPLFEWVYFMKYADKLSVEDVSHMSEPVKNAYGKLVSLSANETLRLKALSREMGMRDQAQRLQDAQEEGRLEGRKEEALHSLQDLLMEFHNLDIAPYLEKLRLQPLEKIRNIRQSLKKETSLVIKELESL